MLSVGAWVLRKRVLTFAKQREADWLHDHVAVSECDASLGIRRVGTLRRALHTVAFATLVNNRVKRSRNSRC